MIIQQQYALSFPVHVSYLDDDFLISDCNRDAWHALQRWSSDKRASVFLLRAEQAGGKTHLATIWAKRHNAKIMNACDIAVSSSPEQYFEAANALVLENIEQVKEEAALFHMLNVVQNSKYIQDDVTTSDKKLYKLLLTVDETACWQGFTLPDLRSRLQALPQGYISPPDDDLVAALLVKHFCDRQLCVGQEVVDYLVKRIERSFSGIYKIVEELDKISAASKKPISIAMARSLLTYY